ncbi:lactoylglutathione lyase [Candidatus Poribacteria bacterium]|nr:lactoylglutathione lyase [Candidatus Poribacteria bacterium]
MAAQLEHANVAVGDLAEAIRFFQAAFPDFVVRGRGTADHGDWQSEWVHVGTDATYVCLNADNRTVGDRESGHRGYGVNHLGFVVDDAQAVYDRLANAGYKEGFQPGEHPHRRRVYFLDGDGNEYEFVEYFSEDPTERNSYD